MAAEAGKPDRLSNRDVAAILANVADMLQILDANRFRIIAFQNAAEAIRTLGQDIRVVHAEGKLQTISGVGKGIADALDELLTEGRVEEFDKLKEKIPPGVVEMIHIPDVGPKTAKRLWDELGITSVEELRQAAEAGRIRELKGFGAKSEQKILKGIELAAKRGDERTPLGEARPLALRLIEELIEATPEGGITRIEAAGSLRRWRETIGDVDILAISPQSQTVIEAFQTPQVVDVARQRRDEVQRDSDDRAAAWICACRAEALSGAAVLHGQHEHNVQVRDWRSAKGEAE